MRTKFKAWTKPYLEEHKEVELSYDDLKSMDNINLEIGSGKGQFLLDMSLKFKDLFFIGIEKNLTCAGFTCKKLVENEITNAKIIPEDADIVLNFFSDKTINNIFLNFSDPWPKKRHHKRRLTAPSYLEKYFRVLQKGGRVIVKTDNDDLYQFSLETFGESKLEIVYQTFDYVDYDNFDTPTEYEMNFRGKGQPIHRLIALKKND